MRTADTAWSSPGSCPGDHSFAFSRGGRKTWPLDGNGTDMNRPDAARMRKLRITGMLGASAFREEDN
ncbi:hypothetical protein GCM10017674_73030 [Streptomyces gardneri]|uniref:Uncharacterized protein n=1 Tax=Streptomyces gardneri TaxID=66892 RepID=A0A4Y3RYM0_9ACTN|nr:hypothetical protein SGA01_74780 [Streptomyces gardneri]GHH19770.1 hypothetical protein GCM10017674_73030 [Streptomyces gardneri]